jgi:hypothetical protein
MSTPITITHLRNRVLASIALLAGVMGLDQTLRWSLPVGILYGVGTAALFSVIAVPWGFLTDRWFKSKNLPLTKTLCVFAPALLASSFIFGSSVTNPPTAANTFHRLTNTSLPKDQTNLHYRALGGGLGGHAFTFSFITSSEEVKRLIQEMHLEPQAELSSGLSSWFSGTPGYSTLEEPHGFDEFARRDTDWRYHLLMKEMTSSRFQVFILIGS